MKCLAQSQIFGDQQLNEMKFTFLHANGRFPENQASNQLSNIH